MRDLTSVLQIHVHVNLQIDNESSKVSFVSSLNSKDHFRICSSVLWLIHINGDRYWTLSRGQGPVPISPLLYAV